MRIIKSAPSKYIEIKLRLLGYGLYLGTIWFNTGNAIHEDGREVWLGRRVKWFKHFQFGRLVRSQGASFWDYKYW